MGAPANARVLGAVGEEDLRAWNRGAGCEGTKSIHCRESDARGLEACTRVYPPGAAVRAWRAAGLGHN